MAKCKLPGCNKKARRKFCCNAHKDRYHNIMNPRGKFAHLKNIPFKGSFLKKHERDEQEKRDIFDDDYEWDQDDHPFSSEALGQY